ncbi:putative zinc finger domain-containing protein [Mimivirus AB-566-O17]|uniref:Putative zinc finger domain-containing protein n=1 Tax=Mimivirus AB-566-O17 TaxID=1988039 RepID=A0A1X9VNX8_9VIRU|nr:putative zinc finger domain-containing protein [Mimivirus AB-566-O17]
MELVIPNVLEGDLEYKCHELRYKNTYIKVIYKRFNLRYDVASRSYTMVIEPCRNLLFNFSILVMNSLRMVLECEKIMETVSVPNDTVDVFGDLELPLFDYQKSDVLWMEGIENKVSSGGIKVSDYIALGDKIYSEEFEILPTMVDRTPVYIKGGNYINEVGLGKSVSVLSLIKRSLDLEYRGKFDTNESLCNYKFKTNVKKHMFCEKVTKGGKMYCTQHLRNAFQDTRRIYPNGDYVTRYKEGRFMSNATLIFCPSHLVKQWMGEVKKFFGDSLRVLTIVNVLNLENIVLHELLGIDIVIISNGVLPKINAQGVRNRGVPLDSDVFTNIFCWDCIQFKRIVYDESHELCEKLGQRSILNSDYIWNVSGTPLPNTYYNYLMNLEILSGVDYRYYINTIDYDTVKSIYRRNTKDSVKLKITNVSESIEWVDFLKVERDIYESYKLSTGNKITKDLVQLCCHPELISSTVGLLKECNSLEEISEKLLSSNVRDLDRLRVGLENYRRDLRDVDFDAKRHIRRMITELTNRIVSKESLTNYLRRSIEELKSESKEYDCAICLGEFDEKIGILPCGHKFCGECILECIGQKKCPTCKTPASKKDLLVYSQSGSGIGSGSVVKEELSEIQVLAKELKSSKLACIVNYITKLGDTDKCVIFSQWSLLLKKMGKQLKEIGIECEFCEGTVYQRTSSISRFVNNKSIKVILLSSKHAASGINLVVANKLILIEPVYGNKEYKENIENQAVGRINRIGQERDIDIVRFLVRDSVEESISNGSEHIKFKM